MAALVRPGSEARLPPGCAPVTGDALDEGSFAPRVAPADTFIQLVGVAHPSPAKAAAFDAVDYASAAASVRAAVAAEISHFSGVRVIEVPEIRRGEEGA